MAKIVKFTTNRSEDQAFRKDVLAALKEVADKYGIEFSLGNGKIAMDGSWIKIDLKAGIVTADGTVESEEARDFRHYAEMSGMKAEWLGQVFWDSKGQEHKITGFRRRAGTRPVTTRTKDGKTFVWPTTSIVHFMGRKG